MATHTITKTVEETVETKFEIGDIIADKYEPSWQRVVLGFEVEEDRVCYRTRMADDKMDDLAIGEVFPVDWVEKTYVKAYDFKFKVGDKITWASGGERGVITKACYYPTKEGPGSMAGRGTLHYLDQVGGPMYVFDYGGWDFADAVEGGALVQTKGDGKSRGARCTEFVDNLTVEELRAIVQDVAAALDWHARHVGITFTYNGRSVNWDSVKPLNDLIEGF